MTMHNRFTRYHILRALIMSSVFATVPLTSHGAEEPAKPTPHKIIAHLADRIYSISELSADQNRYQEEVEKAVTTIREYLNNGGAQADLTEPNKSGMTPLAMASYLGYTPVVEELLKHPTVVESIDGSDAKGVTPWVYSILALRQSAFACNPGIVNNPFSFVPRFVTQAFYLERNPYPAARAALEAAGAKPNMATAKDQWNTLCKNQSDVTRTKVEQSDDIQATVIEAGAMELRATINKLQSRKR